ncbi:probable chalcone--flavonone isomerase 3 [Phalaenopsis equestris]|uniref:probable chalcone--flavonone isomerase 3 n=1 Tax=Phalaenopsis equestris TaxID=78828 RepID=UPI0009E36195|nr:probable chalcone--flavonone isomerase 3 [Phalaenopsis equestris]
MSSKEVMIDEIPFPVEITKTKPLALLGQGLTSLEIHFLQIKHNAIGIYIEKDVTQHLGNWKGKKRAELEDDNLFFDALVSAPVEKLFRIVVIKEIKGSQYGVQLEGAIRDQLAAAEKYEEEEEEALEKVAKFFQTLYLKKDSVITFYFPATSSTAEITFSTDGKGESMVEVENANVVEMMQKRYIGGSMAISPSTVKNLADKFEAILSQ